MQECYMEGSTQWEPFRAEVRTMLANGEVSADRAETVLCDPRKALDYSAEHTEAETGPVDFKETANSGCSRSGRFRYRYTVMGKEAMTYWQTLGWCWNKKKKKVSNWDGICDANVTGWGTANGWRWQGCINNDFIPYKLAGSMPGGVHHRTKGRFSNSYQVWVPDQIKLISVWGHYSDTCDYQLPGGKPTRGICPF